MYRSKYSNDEYFRKNFAKLINKYGGQWIAIAGGKKIMVGPKHMLSEMLKKAIKKFPDDTPLISPIPRKEEMQGIFENFFEVIFRENKKEIEFRY